MVIDGRNALAMEELERNDARDCRPYARGRAHAEAPCWEERESK